MGGPIGHGAGDDPMVLCRGLRYYTPLGGDTPDEAALGCSAHTDYGLISLLHQTAKGLQVLHAEDNAAGIKILKRFCQENN